MNVNSDQILALAGASLLHLLLLGLLLFQWPDRKPEPVASAAAEPVIQARAVSEDEVMAPIRQREEEAARQRRIEAERRAEQQRRAEAERQAVQRRQAEAEAQRRAEEARKQAQAKAQAETQRKAEEARKQAEAQAQAEARRNAEEAKKQAEAQAQAEARRNAEEARKQAEAQAQAETRRKAEEALRQQMAAEQRRLDEETQRQRQAQLDRLQNEYVSQISDKVRRNWLRPDGSRGTLCTVLISQLPDGEVVRVQATRCDGDAAFQRSVENAVLRSSPLPLPADRALFSREIQFNFRP